MTNPSPKDYTDLEKEIEKIEEVRDFFSLKKQQEQAEFEFWQREKAYQIEEIERNIWFD